MSLPPNLIRLKYKVSSLIFHEHSNKRYLPRQPRSKLFPNSIQNLSVIHISNKINSKLLHLTCEALTTSIKAVFSLFTSNWRALSFGCTESCSISQVYFPLCSLRALFCAILSVRDGISLLFHLIYYLDLAWNATMDFEVCGNVWEFGKHITWRNSEFLTSCISDWQSGCIF